MGTRAKLSRSDTIGTFEQTVEMAEVIDSHFQCDLGDKQVSGLQQLGGIAHFLLVYPFRDGPVEAVLCGSQTGEFLFLRSPENIPNNRVCVQIPGSIDRPIFPFELQRHPTDEPRHLFYLSKIMFEGSSENSRRSPFRIERDSRTCLGSVTCPLDVTFAWIDLTIISTDFVENQN